MIRVLSLAVLAATVLASQAPAQVRRPVPVFPGPVSPPLLYAQPAVSVVAAGYWTPNWLSGLADVTVASGLYQVQIQQARVLREESRQAALDTARARLELALERERNRPTARDVIARQRQMELDWARKSPPTASGQAINTLIRSAIFSDREGPEIAIPQRLLGQVTLRPAGTRGNTSLLRCERLPWPEALRHEAFAGPRTRLDETLAAARRSVSSVERKPTREQLRELNAALKALQTILDDRAQKLPITQLIAAQRFLGQVKEALTALAQPDIAAGLQDEWRLRIRSIDDLVMHLRRRGLEVAPAVTASQEAAYRELYRLVLRYESVVMKR
jgi:hypothetical protein